MKPHNIILKIAILGILHGSLGYPIPENVEAQLVVISFSRIAGKAGERTNPNGSSSREIRERRETRLTTCLIRSCYVWSDIAYLGEENNASIFRDSEKAHSE